MQYKTLFIAMALLAATAGTAAAQSTDYPSWGPSHPSPETNCGEYKWPEVQPPCPEVQIKQKHDHTSRYRRQPRPWSTNPNDKGWDTAIDCTTKQSGIVLSCTPYIPVQYFNGYYAVDEIPYNPTDSSFYMNYVPNGSNPNRWKVPVQNDDDYNSTYTNLGFDFFFFGNQRNSFCVGDNGIVTFMPQNLTNISASSNYCPYSIAQEATLPWNTTNGHTPNGNEYFPRMHEAIYGVYEDTYTGSNGSYMSGNQGIYYGVKELITVNNDTCHMGIATWNEIPIFNNSSVRETFQIVCYQGSNIIEVHVRERRGGTSTSYGQGFIGIQNADGNPQHTGLPPLHEVFNNAPAAFWPVKKNNPSQSYNCFTDSIYHRSFRFTPQGTTQKKYEWFRILDRYAYDTIRIDTTVSAVYDTLPNGSVQPVYDTVDGNLVQVYDTTITPVTRQIFDTLSSGAVVPVYDTVHLSNFANDPINAVEDTNGYYMPMDETNTSCPTLTTARVNPKRVSRYVFHLRFQDANGYWYKLYDTIVVGTDTTASLTLRPADSVAECNTINICEHSPANLVMEYPSIQVADTTTFRVYRMSNGNEVELPVDQCLTIGETTPGEERTTCNVAVRANLPQTGVLPNKIDSVYVQAFITFSSTCEQTATALVNTFPNFDFTDTVGICQGEVYTWSGNNQTYSTSVYATEELQSTPGCDSIVHLRLTVYDRSYNIDTVVDCQPYTWINGITYYESNNATAIGDTVLSTNRWGCDSTVQLQFTYRPVTAHIQSDREYFDFDHLDAVLTDVSTNNHSRVWMFPGGFTMSGSVAYYTIPAEYDVAVIGLLATATYDGHTCTDSTSITIPMRKESFWVPNIFTPESASGNNTFGSISTRTLTQEMHIYNRNGQLVFHCEEPDCQWDGRDPSGNLCPQGTYTYLIRYTNEFLPKVVHVLRGTVTLIR